MKPLPEVREIVVTVADWAADRGEVDLVTLGLGSCVAIMMYDPETRVGGMAHVLLPSKSLARDASNPAKFPETAVPLLLTRLTQLGAEPRRVTAKLVGGASMFAALMTPGSIQMGERNVAASRNALRSAAVPIVAEAVGGDVGRSVRMHLFDGSVEIRTVGADAGVI